MAVALEPSVTNTSASSQQPSQTAQEYIAQQLSLEADAREALPYQFDKCTRALGPLRQAVYACLTCTPPPASAHQQHTPAGVCYSCSISCHGEHNLVELFTKRDFLCDCGTTRFAHSGTPCTVRFANGRAGGVVGEEARRENKYNHNFQGTFCGCGDEYDPETEHGTMYQCIGLGTVETGGCGEDWWHPECLMGLPRVKRAPKVEKEKEQLEAVKEESGAEAAEGTAVAEANEAAEENDEDDVPPGFPDEDDFEHLICYKCTTAYPWIKQYAGTPGFLPAVRADGSSAEVKTEAVSQSSAGPESKKRKAEDDADESQGSKKTRTDGTSSAERTVPEQSNGEHPNGQQTDGELVKGHQSNGELANGQQTDGELANGHQSNGASTNGDAPPATTAPKHAALPPAPSEPITLFVKEDFREHLCRCPDCFPRLAAHPQLLEAEETYEPPMSESDAPAPAPGSARSAHSGSLYDRGEAALSSVDRVRAIEGVMAYNHMRDKVKAFLQPFAASGTPVSAEDIKAYFAQLRGDESGMQAANQAAKEANGTSDGEDRRREQGGY